MARKSRKGNEAASIPASAGARCFKTAVYVRLSREDERKVESESVENQISFLKDFVGKDVSLELCEVYADRGVSGTKFDRPMFNRMIEDVRAGKIDCVVVKDLSRLGRNYLEAGDYLEKFFPFFGVRFIAVTDGYDSLKAEPTEEGLAVPLKNLINEAYAKDISRKICTSYENMFRNGIVPVTKIAYGYKIDPENKHHIIVDEEVRDIIVRIFTEYTNGSSITKIARTLNDDGILSPGAYQREKGIVKNGPGVSLWNQRRIKYILQNVIYTGDVRMAKTCRHYYLGMDKRVKRDEGYYVENDHEAIVSHEIFDRAQKLFRKRDNGYVASKKDEDVMTKPKENLFKGILFCADCGNRMAMKRGTVKKNNRVSHYNYYLCNRTSVYGDRDPSKLVRTEKVEEMVLELIRKHIEVYMDAKERLQLLNKNPVSIAHKEVLENRCGELKARWDRVREFMGNLYEDYADGLFSETEYLAMKSGYAAELEELAVAIESIRAESLTYDEEYAGDEALAGAFSRYMGVISLNQDVVQTFIKKIICYSKNRFEIVYNFEDEFRTFVGMVEERGEMLG